MKALCKPLRCLSFLGGRKPPDQCPDKVLWKFSSGPLMQRYTAAEGQHLSKAVDMDDDEDENLGMMPLSGVTQAFFFLDACHNICRMTFLETPGERAVQVPPARRRQRRPHHASSIDTVAFSKHDHHTQAV